jgi:hypothetical protein
VDYVARVGEGRITLRSSLIVWGGLLAKVSISVNRQSGNAS